MQVFTLLKKSYYARHNYLFMIYKLNNQFAVSNYYQQTAIQCVKHFVTTCRDRWINLHKHNDWMFACCSECHVPTHSVPRWDHYQTIKWQVPTGIITLGDDCKLKGSGYTIYTHNNNFFSKMNKYINKTCRSPTGLRLKQNNLYISLIIRPKFQYNL